MIPVVRRGSNSADFDEAHLRRSLEKACYTVGTPEGSAEDIVGRVIKSVNKWLNDKPEVTQDDIRRKASETLERYCPEAGYLYKHQKSIL